MHMKKLFLGLGVAFLIITALIVLSCAKEVVPSYDNVKLTISQFGKRSATATFQADASLPGVLESGICYSKVNEVPTEADKKASGSNSVKLDLLSYETKYFVRAYIKTASKTYYSQTQNFTTIKLPTVKDYDGNVYRIIEMPSTKGLTPQTVKHTVLYTIGM